VLVSVSAEVKTAHANAVHFHIDSTIVYKLQPIAMILLAHFPLRHDAATRASSGCGKAMIQA
jgi:hypothetical protein